jgi:glyoxylase-like metal-dependent hydrolase (beta-lactamase superfamily II)
MRRLRAIVRGTVPDHPPIAKQDSNPVTLGAMATEVAPGIHRLGNEIVNYYLVEADGGLTLVDAGLPGFYDQLEAFLRERGRAVGDIDVLLLTHPHGDHVGIAERVRQAGVPVRIHELDAEQARTGKNHKREGGLLPYLRYGTTWRLLTTAARAGGLKTVKIAEVTPFGEGELDVPGRPRVIHTPGHSPGHVVFHFAGQGALIAGDAVCTWNPLTGRDGPQIMPGAFSFSNAQAMSSLDLIEPIEVGALLVGHGDPWTAGVGTAVARARDAGPS